MVAARGMYEIK